MFGKDSHGISTFVGLLWAFSAVAQVPTDVREKLTSSSVVSGGAFVYASAFGVVRGTREASEEFQVTRAMRSVANKLCEFDPVAGKRLDASISGVTLVSSTVRDKEIEVVIRVPIQKPLCKVTLAENSPLTPAPKADSTQFEESQTRLVNPMFVRSKDIAIRIFGGEY